MLLAGTDTSAFTLEWAISNLVNHPETLKKARTELDNQIGQDRLMDEPDLSKLQYVQRGYDVARETILLVNAWAIHRDPKLWDDPNNFKPERFYNEEGQAHKLTMPFGLGRRACPWERWLGVLWDWLWGR
ncbi:hypothetical protein Patl1_28598 [Pistacia atlantica]|uniref:Uncharacterized protein n=1 Tax=Pistacia atlantica TaxID=434234 RepID=A0ACC1BE97_9ROSI|nr:hypothetical protein Patl1_28598 [Pistacia atlantica]